MDIGHCRGLVASFRRVALQCRGKARPSHSLSFVFCGHFTEEFGERDSKKMYNFEISKQIHITTVVYYYSESTPCFEDVH